MVWSPIWYIFPILIVLFLIIWKKVINDKSDIIGILLIGELSVITGGFSSPWTAWILQSAVIGMILGKIQAFDSKNERRYFSFLIGLFFVITILTEQINHTALPVLFVGMVIILCIFYFMLTEYRIRKMYRDESL